MSLIRVYKETETEYKKLQFFSEVATEFLQTHNKDIEIRVETTFFDFGQDWKYSALITRDYDRDSVWQSVCPRDYENIISSDSFSEIEMWATSYAEGLLNGKISQNITF